MLLIIDNFEQVVAAAPVVSELLTAAPRLKVLLTSRALAGVYGEHDFPVPPLPLPELNDLPHIERLMQVETVRLFVERAQAARPDFRLTGENARTVSDICHQLDGLPLAIELAAARVRHLSPQVLLQRFGEGMPGRLKVLTGGPRTVPERQQTVHATIAWSYDLLDAREQQLFRRLGVFVGGCTLEAAKIVCGWDDAEQVQRSLETLLDTSLLQQREYAESEVRLSMLETIREYALEQLAASGEIEQVQQRHADYFLQLVEGTKPVTTGPGRWWWMRLEAEYDNLRAALAWSRNDERGEYVLRLVVALTRFWQLRGLMNEGYVWLEAAVTPFELDVSSGMSIRNIQRLQAYALETLGTFAAFLGIRDGVQAWYEESLALFRSLGDRAGQLEVLSDLGMQFALLGDFGQGQAMLDECLALAREIGQPSIIADSFFLLGVLAYAQGQSGRAGELWQEGLLLLQPSEDPMQHAKHLIHLSMVALDQDDVGLARAQVMASLTTFHDLGDRFNSIYALEASARLAAEQGHRIEGDQRDLLRAARLFGAAEAIRERLAFPIMHLERRSYDHGLATLRAHLDAASLAVAWTEGRALTLEQAMDYALATDDGAA
jgi:predicted ATPase